MSFLQKYEYTFLGRHVCFETKAARKYNTPTRPELQYAHQQHDAYFCPIRGFIWGSKEIVEPDPDYPREIKWGVIIAPCAHAKQTDRRFPFGSFIDQMVWRSQTVEEIMQLYPREILIHEIKVSRELEDAGKKYGFGKERIQLFSTWV